MMYGTSLRFVVRFAPLVSLLGAACLLIGTASAQESADPKPAPAAKAAAPGEETRLVEVYQLKHSDLRLLTSFVMEAVPGARITSDAVYNRLIVFATPSDHERLKDLLKKIDTPPETAEKQIKVFHLAYSRAESMLNAIKMIVPDKDKSKVRIAVDQRTNSLLATGPEDSLKVIEAVLLRLDETSTPGLPEKTFRVRIVWFAEGTADDDALKPDDDLRTVTDELSKVGAGSMFPVGQTIVSAVPGGEFQVSCSTTFGDGPAELEIRGRLDMLKLTIDISAEREQTVGDADGDAVRHVRLVNLATEIIAPLGHFVVLGVTPVKEKTLAFAVQVLATD